MRDVQAHFIRCFQTPPGMEKMQGTFHFSLNRDGGLIGPPRIAWLQLDKRHQSQEQLEQRLIEAFDRCIPVPLSKDMSRVTPGNVLYFRFGAAPQERQGQVAAGLQRPDRLSAGAHDVGGSARMREAPSAKAVSPT